MPELTTVETVRDWLGVEDTEDTRISLCLEAAEKKIRMLCQNRDSFLSAEYTDEFDGLDWDTVILKHTPVDLTQTTTVALRTSTDTDDDVTVSSTSYRIEDDTGILRLINSPTAFLSPSYMLTGTGVSGYGLPPGFRNVAVTYTGGYESDEIPSDLALIAIEWASALYEARERDPSVKSETLGNHSVTFNTDIAAASTEAQFRAQLIEAGYMRPVI